MSTAKTLQNSEICNEIDTTTPHISTRNSHQCFRNINGSKGRRYKSDFTTIKKLADFSYHEKCTLWVQRTLGDTGSLTSVFWRGWKGGGGLTGPICSPPSYFILATDLMTPYRTSYTYTVMNNNLSFGLKIYSDICLRRLLFPRSSYWHQVNIRQLYSRCQILAIKYFCISM